MSLASGHPTPSLPSSFRLLCTASVFCLPTSRRREQLYKNICRWIVRGEKSAGCAAVHSAACCYTRGPRGKEGRGAFPPSFFLLQNRSEKEKGRKEEKKRRKLVERVGARDIGVCLLRTRPKNRALKAPRLLETLGATFSIGVWREGECGEIMRRGCHECQYFHYFSTRFREACSLLISSSSSFFFYFSFFSPFFHHSFAISSSPSRKNVFHSSAFFRLIFRGYFSTIENDVKKRPQRNTRNTNRADLAGL